MRTDRRVATGRATPRLARRLALTTVVLALGAGALVVPPTGAQSLADAQARAAQVAARLDDLEGKVHRLDDATEQAKGELARAEQALAEAAKRAEQASAEADEQQAALARFSVDAYVSGNASPGIDTLLASDSNDASKVRGYLEVTAGNRQDLVDRLKATRQQAEEEGRRLEEAQAEIEARNAAIQAQLAEAEAAVAEQAAIKADLDGEIATLVAEEQARRQAEAQRQAEERARQQAAATPAGPTGPATARPGAPASPGTAPTPAPGSASPAPAPTAPAPPSAPPAPATPLRSGVAGAVDAAMSKIGSPYVWAAAGPSSFDCSGLVMWAYGQVGIRLPHYSGALYAMTRRISAGEAQPGDLVFHFAPGETGDPGHVGIYIGGGSFVHAPGRGKFVRVDSVHYWSGARVAYGRL